MEILESLSGNAVLGAVLFVIGVVARLAFDYRVPPGKNRHDCPSSELTPGPLTLRVGPSWMPWLSGLGLLCLVLGFLLMALSWPF